MQPPVFRLMYPPPSSSDMEFGSLLEAMEHVTQEWPSGICGPFLNADGVLLLLVWATADRNSKPVCAIEYIEGSENVQPRPWMN